MPENSPYFFMKEFTQEELANLLVSKVNQLKKEKEQTQELNKQLQANVTQLEETTVQLEEAQEKLKNQRDHLLAEVDQKTKEIVKNERLAAIGELSARVAHDLRNPLNVVKNSIEILKIKHENIPQDEKVVWDRIDRSIYRITHQIEDVLEYIKTNPIKKLTLPISTILHDSLERINIPSTVKIELPKNTIAISCEPNKLEIVFVNLIMNAIQAMKNNGKVIIKVSETRDHVLIEVKDTGPGIPPNLIPKIFDPLFTTRQVGTGLGLPSCKKIIERHGGVINVKSIIGKGTSFMIKLPKRPEENISDKINKKPLVSED